MKVILKFVFFFINNRMSTRRSADNLSRTVFSFIEDKYFRTFSTLGYESEGAQMLTDILATIVAVNISGLDEDIANIFFSVIFYF